MNNSKQLSDELVKKIKSAKHPTIKQRTKNTFRTSFTVPESTFQLMNKIKDYYGLATKELIDIIIEFYKNNSRVLDYILKSLEDEKKTSIEGTVKTFIISNDAKKFLEDNSRLISRDVLLNNLTIGFNIRFEQLIEGQKDAVKIIEDFIPKSLSGINAKLSKVLPDNDPIYDRISLIGYAWEDLVLAIKARLDNNTQIDTNDIWQNC